MLNKIEPGDKFDELTFVREIEKTVNRHRRGEFICSCGTVVKKLIHEMFEPRKNPRSCGCVKIVAKTDRNRGRRGANSDGFGNDMANKYLMMRW